MKMHLNLATTDLEKSVAFYQTLLGEAPVKCYDDYALFITEEPGLELALDLNPSVHTGESAHYGVVVDSTQNVDDAIARLTNAHYQVDVEREETCCYAVQTKVWATDPDGRRWETYVVHAESEARDGVDAPCCS